MNLFSEYQVSEITLGPLFFIIIYIIGSYIMTGEFNLKDIVITSILFGIWIVVSKFLVVYYTSIYPTTM